MTPKKRSDLETFNLFVILAFLTVLFVAGLKMVLNAPGLPGSIPKLEETAQK